MNFLQNLKNDRFFIYSNILCFIVLIEVIFDEMAQQKRERRKFAKLLKLEEEVQAIWSEAPVFEVNAQDYK